MAAFTIDGRALENALKLIEADLAEKTEIVQHGHPGAVPDFAIYQRYVGHIMGLMAAKDFITQGREEAQKEEAGYRGQVTS